MIIGFPSLQSLAGVVTCNNLEEKWLDKQDVLERVHISSGTLSNCRRKGFLPYSRVPGKFYYKESDLQKLLHDCNSANKL